MVRYINLLLQAAKHIGEVKDLSMYSDRENAPSLISVTGVTEDGQKFDLHLTVGEYK